MLQTDIAAGPSSLTLPHKPPSGEGIRAICVGRRMGLARPGLGRIRVGDFVTHRALGLQHGVGEQAQHAFLLIALAARRPDDNLADAVVGGQTRDRLPVALGRSTEIYYGFREAFARLGQQRCRIG